MTDIKMPLRDLRFVMSEMLDTEKHYESLGYEEATPDVVDAILEEGAKFCENVLAPLNQIGDQQGCTWKDGEVTTPEGFKEAYQQFVEAGWAALPHDPEYGGQGLPPSLGTIMSEMVGTANWSWGMYPGLSHGAMNTLEEHGTEEQKQVYLTKLVEGSWTGTMCLTEPHCGTDLGMLRSKAEPNSDGSYAISGTKIFISAGEHDMTDNIVHIVLARLPDAPAGTKGISLFIVPKFLPNADGAAGERNGVACGSLEHKMGIHGNATAVLNFDGAKGYLIGEANKGLSYMFTFMNTARLGTALQGLSHSEIGFQKSLAYAKDRLQMRSLSGVKNPEGPADPIIVHPDVRRMLMTQKAISEGGRMLVVTCAQLVDVTHKGDDEAKKSADDMLAFLTPIAKAFLTEAGCESANLGMQCFGGHGYIAEWGMEQNVRDARISTIYEGTTGIQALDLLGRKVLMTQGELLRGFTKKVHNFCQAEIDNEALAPFVTKLQELNKQWGDLTLHVGGKAMENPDEVGAASVDYLMFSGYTVLAYLWASAAKVANEKLAAGTGEEDFYRAKLTTARFYFERILPRTSSHATSMLSGASSLMELDAEHFAF
ncbi:acyl-CoA dehydrogenase C-terminal domain-containing protein [Microbulbifer sp. OS29]|uniref:3-methylmercaptopropionyl-CoA dehydrogenase n=1 Tax=Microbulbifer okhotskensis TaxID=2926617 RepID=A0A9X2EP29_9GAMM|nr:acyl-CoA dehydrogenase C-terminal domain-containing protein [Microbulbifer okhotskensis]MCO1335809.1 acyl-CoA dehydrogenase C-terminal domain-containing protein [Microbulbifer okhotskensis]